MYKCHNNRETKNGNACYQILNLFFKKKNSAINFERMGFKVSTSYGPHLKIIVKIPSRQHISFLGK